MAILDAPTPERIQELRNAGWDEEAVQQFIRARTPQKTSLVTVGERDQLLAAGTPPETVDTLIRDRAQLYAKQTEDERKEAEQRLLAQTKSISVEEAEQAMIPPEVAGTPIDIVKEWDVNTLANTPEFSLEAYVAEHPDVMQDNEKVAKLSEVWQLKRGKPPTAGEVGMGLLKLPWNTVKAVYHTAKGTGKMLYDVAAIPAAGALTGLAAPEALPELQRQQEKTLAEDIAGFEKGTFGFAQFMKRAAVGTGRKLGMAKSIAEMNPEERQVAFRDEMQQFLQGEAVGKGESVLAPSLVQETIREQGPLNPASVEAVAQADPVGFMLFGQAFHAAGAVRGAVKGVAKEGQTLARLREVNAELKQTLPKGDVTRDFSEALLEAAEREAGALGRAAATVEGSVVGQQLSKITKVASDLADARLRAGLTARAASEVPSQANLAASDAARNALSAAETAANEVLGARTVAALQGALSNVSPGAAGVQAAGRSLEAAGAGLRGTARVIEAAPTVAGIAGAAKAALSGNLWVAGGLLLGSRFPQVRQVAQAIAKPVRALGEKLELVGKGVRTTPTSSFQQGLRGLAMGSAEAAMEGVKGLPLDIGVGLALADTGEDVENMSAYGSAFRLAGALGRPFSRFVQSVKAGPRAPQNAFIPRQGGFLRQSSMESEANRKTISPQQQAWLGATEKFLRDVGSQAPVYLLTNPEQFYNFLRTQHERTTGSPPTPEQDARLRNYSQQKGVFAEELIGDDGTRGGAIVVTSPDVAPHEGLHAFQQVLGQRGNEYVDTLIRSEFSDEAWEARGKKYVKDLYGEDAAADWRAALRPLAEAKNMSPDQYMAREVGAEVFDTVFKSTGGQPFESSLTRKLAGVVDRVARFFGINPMEGVVSEGQQVPVTGRLQEIVTGAIEPVARAVAEAPPAVPGAAPTVPRPAGPPRPPGPQAPPTAPGQPGAPNVRVPDPVQQRAIDEYQARTPERLNIDMAREQARQSGDPAMPQIVEQIGSALQRNPGEAVVLNVDYASVVPGSREERLSRTLRRAAQAVPEAVRDIFEKRIAVTRFIMDEFSGGKLQLMSMSLEKIMANVVNIQQRLEAKGLQAENPYADPQTGQMTEKSWRDLVADVITYTSNQANGYRGGGRELVLPADAAALKIAVPEVNPSYRPTILPEGNEQFLNMIMGVNIPKTAREFKGIVPGSVKGQVLREAQGEVTLEPGDLEKRQPGKQAFKSYPGRVVREVNPLRQRLEKAGVNTREMIEVTERLNMDRIAAATPDFSMRFNLPVTDVIRAGFMPKDPVKAAEENRRRGVSAAAFRLPSGEIITGVSHFDALLRGINEGRIPRESIERGVEDLGMEDGFVDGEGNFLTRNEAFQRSQEVGQISGEQAQARSYRGEELESTMFAEQRAFQPKAKDEKREKLSGETLVDAIPRAHDSRWWVSPDGKLFRVDTPFEGPAGLTQGTHGNWVERNLEKLTFLDKSTTQIDAEGRMKEAGWARMVLNTQQSRWGEPPSILIEPGTGKNLTKSQRSSLETVSMNLDLPVVDARFNRPVIQFEKPSLQLQPKVSELRDKAKRGLSLTQEERTLLANSTSRNWDKLTVAAQILADKIKPTDGPVLDFGAGKNAIQTKLLRDRGYDVTAYEFGENVNPQLHDRDALAKRYATVMASNVLNVQSSPGMFRGTIQDMAKALAEGGKVIVNFPDTPRYLDQTAPKMEARLKKYFNSVEKIGGTASEPVWQLSDPKLEAIPPRPVRKAVREVASEPVTTKADPKTAEALQESGVPATSDGSSPAGPSLQFMTRDYEHWLDKYFFNNEEAKKYYGQQDMENFAKGMRMTAKIFGDFSTVPAEGEGSPVRGNLDPKFSKTFDITTVCPKQDQFVAVTKALEMERGKIFTAKEKALIGEMLRESGFATCFICYGQGARNAWDEGVQIFTDIVNRAIEEPNWESAPKARREEIFGDWSTGGILEKYLDANMPELKKRGPLSGPDVRALIREERKASDDFEMSFASLAAKTVQGAVKANQPKGFEQYTDQLKGSSAKKEIEKFNQIAGFRMNSQSDFRVWHVLETAQFLTDLAQQGGMAHVYTRMDNFLRIFGKTGIKFNMSVEVSDPATLPLNARYGKLTYEEFKKLREEHGDPMWDDMNSFPEAQVDRWRKELPRDAGSMLVALNDYQVWWGLDNPKIDMMIPYHQGSVKPETTAMYGARDYKAEQHEHFPDDWKPGESRTAKLNDGSEVTLTMGSKKVKGKETRVQPIIVREHHKADKARYLEITEKLGITPIFERFKDHPNYMKLVRDAAREPNNQVVVDPTKINWEEAMKIVDEWVKSGDYVQETEPDPALLRLVRDRVAEGDFPRGPVIEAGLAKDIGELMSKKEAIKKEMRKPKITPPRGPGQKGVSKQVEELKAKRKS